MTEQAKSKARAHEIKKQIRDLTEELKALPWDEQGFINWNLHCVAKKLQAMLPTIDQAVRS